MNSLTFHKKTSGPKKVEGKNNVQVHIKLYNLYSSLNAGRTIEVISKQQTISMRKLKIL